MSMRDDLANGTYVAHRDFRNGADCEGRARRRCQRCGGVQYDWGGGGWDRRNLPYVMHWYCNGRGACGFSVYERMSTKRFYELRQNPPKLDRAPGWPWKRWRSMRARHAGPEHRRKVA